MNVSAIASQLASPGAAPGQPAERTSADAKKASAQFEAILVRQLLSKSMTSMLGTGTENNTATSVYGDMLTDTLAQQLTTGPGLGLGRMIESQLSPRATLAKNLPKP